MLTESLTTLSLDLKQLKSAGVVGSDYLVCEINTLHSLGVSALANIKINLFHEYLGIVV